MLLKELLNGLDYEILTGNLEKEIKNITQSDRNIEENDIYICVSGFKVDGHDFALSAIEKGAKAIICERPIKTDREDVSIIKVEDSRCAMAKIASNYYGNPSSKLKLIGITGTNGKTTSAFLMKDILERAGKKVGLIGTIANYIGKKAIHTERTTPGPIELHELFKEMVDSKVEYCVMEVSSHSLALNRVYGLEFLCGIYTNLTRDHLDFHKTFEEYYKAKFKLFEASKNCIINIDDEYGLRVLNDLKGKNKNIVTYSIHSKSDLIGCNIKADEKGSNFKVKSENEILEFFVDIPGEYNVYNSLGCIGASRVLNISNENIKKGLEEVTVPGRCERVGKEFNLPFEIIIDYAHTPDGLENILKTARDFTKNRLISVFGCGGDRDKVKRPIMGKVGSKLSDIALITSDNPRTEEPMEIIKEIINGINKENYTIIENRYEAIKEAINIAKDGDVIVIAGKGHETYQILKEETIHFDEREVVTEILNEVKK